MQINTAALKSFGIFCALVVAVLVFWNPHRDQRRLNEATDITDLKTPAVDILRGLPGVADVRVLVKVEKPSARYIQLVDLPLLTKEAFTSKLKQEKRGVTEEQVDAQYQQHVREVEAVQEGQMALLRVLIQKHGLKEVGVLGWTERTRADFEVKIEALRAVEKQMPALQKQLDEVRLLMVQMQATERDKTERYDQVADIEKEISGLVEKHRLALLAVGAGGRLLMAGELGVFPLEADELQGGSQTDEHKAQVRNDAIVRNALEHGPVTVIILGDVDLTESVRRLSGVEYAKLAGHNFQQRSY